MKRPPGNFPKISVIARNTSDGPAVICEPEPTTEGIITKEMLETLEENRKNFGETQTLKQEMVDQLAKEMEALYQGTFSERKLGSRYLTFKRAAMNLQESFSSLDVFWTKDFFTKFMAESQIVKEKEPCTRQGS